MSIAHYPMWQLERTRDSARWHYRHAVQCVRKARLYGWRDGWTWANQAQGWRQLWINASRELRSRGEA